MKVCTDNVFEVTVTFVVVKPSLHEVWAELNSLPELFRKVDIKHINQFTNEVPDVQREI